MQISKCVRLTGCLSAIIALTSPVPVLAEENTSGESVVAEMTPPTDVAEAKSYRTWLQVGWFYPTVSTTLRLDNSALDKGTEVNFEDDLGMEDRLSQVSVQAGFYMTKRWRISGEFFELKRSQTHTLSKDIEWGDETFNIGVKVDSYFNIEIYRIAVGYDIVQNNHSVFGVAIGTHMLRTGAGIDAVITGGSQSGSRSSDATSDGIFPIPNIGLYYWHDFNANWRLDTRIDWFGISVGEWDGNLISSAVFIRYFVTPNVSIGVGAEYFRIKVDYDQESWHGQAKMEYYGPVVDLGVRF